MVLPVGMDDGLVQVSGVRALAGDVVFDLALRGRRGVWTCDSLASYEDHSGVHPLAVDEWESAQVLTAVLAYARDNSQAVRAATVEALAQRRGSGWTGSRGRPRLR